VRVQWRMHNHVGESLTRPRSCCHCTPAALRGVGTRIECGCPLVASGCLPQVLSLLPEMGLDEADMASQGWGSLGRDGDLPKLTPHLKSGSGEAEFWVDPKGGPRVIRTLIVSLGF
jgi:hypothetical protein